MKFDLMNHIDPVVALDPVVVTDGTKQTSRVVDLQGYHGCAFIIACGTLADSDAVWDVTIKEGDSATQGEHTAVSDDDLIGTEALAQIEAANDDQLCRKIGYKGSKRYVSIEMDDTTANSGNAPFCIIALRGRPEYAPTDNPPEGVST